MSKKFFCLLFVLALAGRLDAEDGPVEPYVVYVARDGEFARCGPSEEYYKTDPLRPGAEVEVYLETEDGWLGIRPPADSFCWLQSDQVDVAEDETSGTVIESSAVAWIGTHLGKARQYRWQVRLDEGEPVTIIGTATREGPEGEEVWYRIVPPPGEFRWVQRSQVTDGLENVVYGPPAASDRPAKRYAADAKPAAAELAQKGKRAEKSRADRTADTAAREPENHDQPAAEENPLDSVLDGAPVGSGLAKIESAVGIRSIGETEAAGSALQNSQDADWTSGSRVVPASAVETAAAPLQATAPPQLGSPQAAVLPPLEPSGYQPSADVANADLDALRLELSHAMAAAAHAHEVEPLRARIAQLTEHASESVVRGRASLLLRRVEEYQRVAQQRGGRRSAADRGAAATPSAPAPTSTAAPTIPLGALAQNTSTSATASAAERGGEAGARFDGQGWLVRVYSARPNAPPYAITDSAGRTLSYVTPAAGINMRRYLNQEIGLYGRVAADTSLETPHLIAEQAVRLRTR